MDRNDDSFARNFLEKNTTILFGEYTKRLNAIKNVKTRMTSTDFYIKWLVDFTQKQGTFYDSDWLYKAGELPKEDYLNVRNLQSFYDAIYDYLSLNASRSYFNKVTGGKSFDIKYQGVTLAIGFDNEQGTSFFSKVTSEDPSKTYIDFEKVLNGEKFECSIEEDLDEFRRITLEAYYNGLNDAIIREALNITLDHITGKDKQRKRTDDKRQA